MMIRYKYPDTKVHVFYIDVRTPGKNFDEFYRRAVEEYGEDPKHVESIINKTDKKRASYYNYYSDKKWGAMDTYHLSIDSGKIGIDNAVKLIIDFAEMMEE